MQTTEETDHTLMVSDRIKPPGRTLVISLDLIHQLLFYTVWGVLYRDPRLPHPAFLPQTLTLRISLASNSNFLHPKSQLSSLQKHSSTSCFYPNSHRECSRILIQNLSRFFHVLRHFLAHKDNFRYRNRILDKIAVISMVDLVLYV